MLVGFGERARFLLECIALLRVSVGLTVCRRIVTGTDVLTLYRNSRHEFVTFVAYGQYRW